MKVKKLCDTMLDENILNIIQHNEIFEQSNLQKILKERGYDIPQATLSRRLRKLRIAKVSGTYKIVDLNKPNIPIVLDIQVSEFGLIIMHTYPGHASSLAYFFDKKYVTCSLRSSNDSGILGTIAGDDTMLILVKSKSKVNHVLSLIYKEFPYLTCMPFTS